MQPDSAIYRFGGPASLSSVDSPASRDQNGTAQSIFTQQWAIYRRFVDADYLSHRAFFGILRDLVAARKQAFSFGLKRGRCISVIGGETVHLRGATRTAPKPSSLILLDYFRPWTLP
jgi:hypothetical protein